MPSMYWAKGMTEPDVLDAGAWRSSSVNCSIGGVGIRGLGVLLDGINIHRGLTVAGHLVRYRGKSGAIGRRDFE